jgi:hypothetical protein
VCADAVVNLFGEEVKAVKKTVSDASKEVRAEMNKEEYIL